MAIDLNEGDGNGKGPSMCTSASHNISAFTELTLENGDTQPATLLNMDVLDVNVDFKRRDGCDVSAWDWSGRRLIRQEMFFGRKWSKDVRLHREL